MPCTYELHLLGLANPILADNNISFLFPGFPAALSNPCLFSAEKCRVFRPDKSYAVSGGKWYFEFEIVTAGKMRVGWARPSCTPDKELGSDDLAYVFDGFEVSLTVLINLKLLN